MSTGCEHCGEVFESTRPNQRFCSRECVQKSQRRRETLECPGCGEEFEVCKSEVDKYTYCSNECRRVSNRVDLTCEMCSETFTVPGWLEGTQRFCSQSCANKNAGGWNRGGDVTCTCEHCGEEFDVPPYRADARRFCSRECSHAYRSAIARETKPAVECPVCYDEVPTYRPERRRYCSVRCRSIGQKRRIGQYTPRPPRGREGFEKLVDRCYFKEGHNLDATHRIVHHRLEDGEQWSREDIEDFVNDLLTKERKMEQRLLAMRPEDIGLSPIGETSSPKTVTDGGVDT